MTATPRNFKTDYNGLWPGFCRSRESAIVAAVRHIVAGDYSKATITDLATGRDIVRIARAGDECRVNIITETRLLRVRKV